MKRIVIVVPETASNGFIRAAVTYKALDNDFDVQMIGFGHDIFPVHDDVPIKFLRCGDSIKTLPRAIKKLLEEIDDDCVVIASKLRLRSFFISLIIKCFKGVPLFLDCDDWDASKYYSEPNYYRRFKRFRPHIKKCSNPIYNALLENLVRFADKAVVGSTFLAERYNGTLLYHPYLPPGATKSLNSKKITHGDSKAVAFGFAGTVFRYKGLDELGTILERDFPSRAKLRIAGKRNVLVDGLIEKYPRVVEYIGVLPPREMPSFLATVDIVVIFQQDTLHANGGVPAKLFDAMAMGKAIIASDVSDIRSILGESGVVISPGSIDELRDTVHQLMNDEDLRQELGTAAAKRYSRVFPENYILDGWKKILDEYV